MKLYSNGYGEWVGTQADAKQFDRTYHGGETIDVPTDKPNLLAFLNRHEVNNAETFSASYRCLLESDEVLVEQRRMLAAERHYQSCSANDVSGYDVTDVVLNCDRKHLGKALAAIISRLHDEVEAV